MRSNSFFLIIATFTAIFLLSCHGGTGKTDAAGIGGMSIDSISIDSAVSLGPEKDAPSCSLSLRIMFLKGARQAKTINDTVLRNGVLTPDYLSLTSESLTPRQATDSFATRFLAEYARDYGRMYRADRQHASSYNFRYSVRTAVESHRENTITYVAHIYIIGGDTRGTRQTLAMNFDASTGRMLRLADIFVPGHEQTLKEMITEQLCEDRHAADEDGLRQQGLFEGTGVYAPENFIAGSRHITFIYNMNEIAGRDEGEIRVELPVSGLKKIMRKNHE